MRHNGSFSLKERMDVQHPHRQVSIEAKEQNLNVQVETHFPKAQTPFSHVSVFALQQSF